MGHSVGLVLINATRQWFIRFCATPNNLGVPVSSWGTLEYNRVGLIPYSNTKLRPELCIAQAEPVFVNIYGAQESIPRNEFRLPM